MKFTSLVTVTCMAAVLAVGSVGCKKKPTSVTNLPYNGATARAGQNTGANQLPKGDPISTGPIGISSDPLRGSDVNPITNTHDIDNPARPRDPNMFASETIYFALDKAIVEQKEMGKIAAVADFIAKNPSHDLLVEGHCDERGTEGYNLALGDRRALAVREALIAAGAPADNIVTVSYGESRPADPGHTQAAWAKNRRGAFVLVLPAQ